MTLKSSANGKSDVALTPEDIAMAAVWLTVLQRPGDDAQMEAGFARWLMASRAHQQAFRAVMKTWNASGRLKA